MILQRFKGEKKIKISHKFGDRRGNLEIYLNSFVKMEMQNLCMKTVHSAGHVCKEPVSLFDILKRVTVVLQTYYNH